MTTTYAAHIVTTTANLGDPEVIVMTASDETGAADFLAAYPLPDDDAWEDVLASNGWRVIGDPEHGDYAIVDVEAAEVEQIIKHVTFARAQAEIEHVRQDLAWRTLIADAKNDGGSATRLAVAADISRERVYQIRDGRR